MQCEKCQVNMVETRRVVKHPVETRVTMTFAMMDCESCGTVTATDSQREQNNKVYNRVNKSLYRMFG